MSAANLDVLKTIGTVAAPAGIAIGAFLYLGRDIIAKNIFPTLTRQQAFHVIMSLIGFAGTIALAGIAAYVYVTVHQTPGPGPIEERGRFRLVVHSIDLMFDGGPGQAPNIHTSMSISNVSPSALTLDIVHIGVIATASDSTTINWTTEPVRTELLGVGSVKEIEFKTKADAWQQMGNPVKYPELIDHTFQFMIQVWATDATDGRQYRLNVNVGRPSPMNARFPDLSVFDLNILAGEKTEQSCEILPNGSGFTPSCMQN